MSMRASVARRSHKNFDALGLPARARSQERSVQLEFDSAGSLDDEQATEKQHGDSERETEPNANRKSYRRSMSDPFDTAESGGVTDGGLKHSEDTASDLSSSEDFNPDVQVLPTLPRFPVLETRDKNCWSETPVSIFQVRGKDYLTNKKKEASDPYLLRARGVDLFVTDHPHKYTIEENVKGVLGGNLRKAPSLLIRLTFPWGILVQYFEIESKLAPFLRPAPHPSMKDFTPAEKTLAKWLMGDAAYKNERLKLIPYVAEGPWVVRTLVTGRPALIANKLPVTYKYTLPNPDLSQHDFLVCDLDIGSSSATAKKIVSVCRRYMSALTVDMGFVIQGTTPEELPEQMMGGIRIHRMDPLKAPSIGK